MEDKYKTKRQLIDELVELRQLIVELEESKSECERAENSSEIAVRFAESIIETVREPLLVLDADLKVLSANRSFYNTFKVIPTESVGSFIYDLGNKQWDIPRLRILLEDVLPHNTKFDGFEVDHDFPIIGRKVMMLNARRIFNEDIRIQMILLIIEDITKRKRLEEKLFAISITDDLTGLYNRRGLFTLGDKLLKISKRQKKGLFMLYADLDDLKVINDTLGHKEGDRALFDCANVLRKHYRESDIIARIGGDEFVVFLVADTGDSTKAIISRLQNAVKTYNSESNRSYNLSLSAGIAYYDPESHCSIGELLEQGDKSMYEQKKHKLNASLRIRKCGKQ